MKKIINQSFLDHQAAFDALKSDFSKVEQIANLALTSLGNNGKIIFAGNGGSAADAQHLAAELISRFKKNRKSLAGLALTTDTSILTSIGNDFGFEYIFSRQLEGLATKNDLLILLSTSGNSANLLLAADKAKELGIKTVALLGKDGGKLHNRCDIELIVASYDTARIQEMHSLIGHIICEIIETSLS